MVVTLGPGKFYGSSLPRPRFYTDVKLNTERVDPPPSVMDPLVSWAEEAHWSMGGLNFKRHRLQGRIEGKIENLRAQRETFFVKNQKQQKSGKYSPAPCPDKGGTSKWVSKTPSPPPSPLLNKRRRVVGPVDEEEEVVVTSRGPVRKLGNDFERVARETSNSNDTGRSNTSPASLGADKGKKKKLVKVPGRKIGAIGSRSSPRLAKSSGST